MLRSQAFNTFFGCLVLLVSNNSMNNKVMYSKKHLKDLECEKLSFYDVLVSRLGGSAARAISLVSIATAVLKSFFKVIKNIT